MSPSEEALKMRVEGSNPRRGQRQEEGLPHHWLAGGSPQAVWCGGPGRPSVPASTHTRLGAQPPATTACPQPQSAQPFLPLGLSWDRATRKPRERAQPAS